MGSVSTAGKVATGNYRIGWDGREVAVEATGPSITVDGKKYQLLGYDAKGSPVYEDARIVQEQEAAKADGQNTEDYSIDWLKSIGAESTELNTVDKYLSAKYDETDEYGILDGYRRAVEKGDISPLVGLPQYKITAAAVESNIVGEFTATNIQVEGYVSHFVDRVIGQSADSHSGKRKGVPVKGALDAMQNPISQPTTRVMPDGDVRQIFIGQKAKVTISIRDKILIQTNPR